MKRKIFLSWIILGISLAISVSIVVRTYASNYEKIYFQEYIVQPDDTLWMIAVGCNINQDIRETIYEIRKKNRLDSAIIYPGQVLYIPFTKEDGVNE